jgi:hypothetical protein
VLQVTLRTVIRTVHEIGHAPTPGINHDGTLTDDWMLCPDALCVLVRGALLYDEVPT